MITARHVLGGPALALGPSRAVALLPGCVLLLMSVAFVIAFLGERSQLFVANAEVALLLPLLWLAFQPSVRICDGQVERFLCVAVLLCVWLAGVQWLRVDALPCGWYRFAERGAALATTLFMVSLRAPAELMIRALGVSATGALAICAAVEAHLGLLTPLSTVCFGLGQINILANTAGPSLICWVVAAIVQWRSGQRLSRLDAMVMGAGILSLLAIEVGTHRRGILLAVLAAGAWLSLAWLWRRSRLAAGVVALVAAGLLAAIAVHLFRQDVPSLRNERIDLYRAAWSGIAASWPWGFGSYGMIHLQTVASEACRHLTACGGWGTHAHDEFLDVTLDGGPIALLLAIALVVMTWHRLLMIRDHAVRTAYQAMAAAILAHLLTDNVFGTTAGLLWLGSAAGAIFAAPVAGKATRAWAILPRVWLLALPLALIALWGAWSDYRSCMLSKDAGTQEQQACLATVYDPQLIDYHALSVLIAARPPVDLATRRFALQETVARMGWTGRTAELEAERALAADKPEQAIAGIVRVLAFSPFYKDAYARLQHVLDGDDRLSHLVPKVVRIRLAYLRGNPLLLAPDLSHRPATIDEASDAYAAIIWMIACNHPWSQVQAPLWQLCQGYGDIPGVAELVIEAARTAPAGTFPWLGKAAGILEVGLRFIDPAAVLRPVATAEQAQALMPLLTALYPGIIADCARASRREGRDSLDLRDQVVRVWGLSRLGSAAPSAPRPTHAQGFLAPAKDGGG